MSNAWVLAKDYDSMQIDLLYKDGTPTGSVWFQLDNKEVQLVDLLHLPYNDDFKDNKDLKCSAVVRNGEHWTSKTLTIKKGESRRPPRQICPMNVGFADPRVISLKEF